MSTLSTLLIEQREQTMAGYGSLPPQMAPLQTPTTSRTAYQAPGTPLAHGADGSQFGMYHGMSPFMSQGFFGTPGPAQFTAWSEDKVATLQARLQKRLGPEYVTQRAGPGGGPKLR